MFKEVIGILENIAPTLATALAGPLAGVAVKSIGSALGMSDATKEGILSAVQSLTPEQKLALERADHEFEIELKQIASKNFELEVGDAESARKREVDLSNSKWGWLPLSVQNFGALVIIFIMIMMSAWGLFYHDVDPQNQSQIINTNYNIILLLVGYWWGKSKKDQE